MLSVRIQIKNKSKNQLFLFSYSENDLIDLLRINSYGIPVLFWNHCPQFLNKFKNIQNSEVLECLHINRDSEMIFESILIKDLRFIQTRRFETI